jgi:hypothetical protein
VVEVGFHSYPSAVADGSQELSTVPISSHLYQPVALSPLQTKSFLRHFRPFPDLWSLSALHRFRPFPMSPFSDPSVVSPLSTQRVWHMNTLWLLTYEQILIMTSDQLQVHCTGAHDSRDTLNDYEQIGAGRESSPWPAQIQAFTFFPNSSHPVLQLPRLYLLPLGFTLLCMDEGET